eukprot:322255_1
MTMSAFNNVVIYFFITSIQSQCIYITPDLSSPSSSNPDTHPLDLCTFQLTLFTGSDLITPYSIKYTCNNELITKHKYENTNCEGTADTITTLTNNIAYNCNGTPNDCNIRSHYRSCFSLKTPYSTVELLVDATCATREPTNAPTTTGYTKSPTIYIRQGTGYCSLSSQCVTFSPTMAPTRPTAIPTHLPSVSPSTNPPTTKPSMAPIVSKWTALANADANDIVNMPLLVAAVIFSATGTVVAVIALIKYGSELKQEKYVMRRWDTIKLMTAFDYILIVAKIADIVTDFMFATDTLLKFESNRVLTLFGWICFLTGIIGVILFYAKFLLMRKLMYKKKRLQEEKKHMTRDHDEIMDELRKSSTHCAYFDLLNASLEDCPQMTCNLMISLFSGFSIVGLLDLAVTILLLFWSVVAPCVSYCGCDDPVEPKYKQTPLQEAI